MEIVDEVVDHGGGAAVRQLLVVFVVADGIGMTLDAEPVADQRLVAQSLPRLSRTPMACGERSADPVANCTVRLIAGCGVGGCACPGAAGPMRRPRSHPRAARGQRLMISQD